MSHARAVFRAYNRSAPPRASVASLIARVLLPVLLVALSKAAAGLSQAPGPRIESATRVRFLVIDTADLSSGESRSTFHSGTIAGFDGRFLILRSGAGTGPAAAGTDTLRVPVTNIAAAEAYAGNKRYAFHGAIGGLVLGATMGFLLGQTPGGGQTDCHWVQYPWGEWTEVCNNTPVLPDTRPKVAALLAGIGAVAGATVGYFIQTERWAHFDVASLRVQLGFR